MLVGRRESIPPTEASMKPASLLAVLVFSLVSIAQLARLVFQIEVLVNGAPVPMWVSVIALFVAGALAVALWREARQVAPERAA
jgi:hypothetical protein